MRKKSNTRSLIFIENRIVIDYYQRDRRKKMQATTMKYRFRILSVMRIYKRRNENIKIRLNQEKNQDKIKWFGRQLGGKKMTKKLRIYFTYVNQKA